MWGRRSPEVQELILYFDREDRRDRWDKLSKKEAKVIALEVDRCRKDFSYAARNYFMIVTKDGEDVPFALWESQELILEKWYWLRNKFPDRAQKLMILKARQLGTCLDPKTRVLTADLRWVTIESLEPEEEIVAVEEEVPGGRGCGRKMTTGRVVAKLEVQEDAYRLTMDNGETLIATGEHRFLCKLRGGTEAIWVAVNAKKNGLKSRSPIRVGDEIRTVTQPWEGASFEDGWIAGMLDGEGSLRKKERAGVEVCISQIPGEVFDRVCEYFKSRGYSFRVETDERKAEDSSKFGDQPVMKAVLGRMHELFRLIGQTRPTRFIPKRWWEDKDLPGKCKGGNRAWSKVVSIEPLGKRRMIDLQTTTKTFIAEGFVSHNSTVIEGLIAWATIFFSNRNAIVVSHNDPHAAYLFKIMLDIYDRLPWWLKPMCSSRKQDSGLVFANPNIEERRERPGNNSTVSVQSASQISGVGRGMRLNAVHVSEYALYDWGKFKEIIDGDLMHAIANNNNSFAFLESTGQGAGSPAEEMWVGQVELAEEADWVPLFIPWFFEKTRVLAPEEGWIPQQPELEMRDKISRDWVRCDDGQCGNYLESSFRRENRNNKICPECQSGRMRPVILRDIQLRFMQHQRVNAEKKGLESVKKLKEELAVTAEEAWQLSGIQVFPPECFNFVAMCVDANPIIWGDIDTKGQIHYMKTDGKNWFCAISHCQADHRWDLEHPLQIWELPQPNCQYCVGVDVAEGLSGKSDYSVIFVNKVSPNGRSPDEQVALWRSNTVDPIQLASPVNYLGRLYNDALMTIEVNKYDTCFNTVRLQYLYPNMFVWKHYDSKNPMSNKLGWVTNMRSKPMLWQTAVRWLKSKMWIIRSRNFLLEMKKFQKDDYDDMRASAERNYHDDELIAGMMSLFSAHDLDYSEDLSFIPAPLSGLRNLQAAGFTNSCERCKNVWDTEEIPDRSCPRCRCLLVTSHRNSNENTGHQLDWSEMTKFDETDEAIAEQTL